MKYLLMLLLCIPIASMGQNEKETQDMSIEELNEFLFVEYALRKNTKPMNDIATDDFVLIAAPGMLENKTQVIKGVVNLNMSSVNVITDKIFTDENIGIVIGTLELKGTIMNKPVPNKIRYSSTFIKIDGNWRLKMRTMTPMRR